ncbi:MAG: metallophosphoesterase [Hyphomonadaceae bacterium]|nr:metallophosphoesterase [Hyphomonadaceae bacterium]
MVRVVQFSDTHLRASQWRHQRGFSRAVRRAGPGAHILVTGDLTVDGADHDSDLRAAQQRFARLDAPVHVIPGNHDIGEEPASPRQMQPISVQRRARFLDIFGSDRFDLALPGWRLIGLNVHLFGTGWAEEEAQWADLEQAVATRGESRIAVFLHKPLFIEAPDEPEAASWAVAAPARDRLLDLAIGGAIAIFASGHLHQALTRTLDETLHVWVPATANAANTPRTHGALLMTGAAIWDFTPGKFKMRFVQT